MKKLLLLILAFTFSTTFAEPPSTPIDPELLSEIQVAFHSTVFSGERFPNFDFAQPHLAREILGPCTLTADFYDAQMNKVDSAKSTGRFGAIVTITPDNRPAFKRFITLYHTPKNVDWRDVDLHTSLDFPADTGLSSAIVRNQLPTINDYVASLIHESLAQSPASHFFPGTAAVFATLHDTAATAGPLFNRDSPIEQDAIWWYHLKKKTGDYVPLKFLVYVPKAYNEQNDGWPLVLFLHGSGERGDDLDKVKAWGIARMGAIGKDMPFVAICPQCPADQWWLATELNDLVTDICARYRIDQTRLYVTGLSMGGFATWSIVQQFPDRYAAAIPICGVGDPRDVARIQSLPVWIFHGGADPTVPVQASREMAAALRAEQGNVHYTEFPGVGHVSWEKAYATPELFPWMLAQHRAVK